MTSKNLTQAELVTRARERYEYCRKRLAEGAATKVVRQELREKFKMQGNAITAAFAKAAAQPGGKATYAHDAPPVFVHWQLSVCLNELGPDEVSEWLKVPAKILRTLHKRVGEVPNGLDLGELDRLYVLVRGWQLDLDDDDESMMIAAIRRRQKAEVAAMMGEFVT